MALLADIRQVVSNSVQHRRAAPASGLTDVQRERWESDGFLILPGFFSQERLAPVEALVDEVWRSRGGGLPLTVDTPGSRMLLRDVESSVRQQVYKLNDLYLEYDIVRALNLDAALVAVLQELIDGEPAACNSLNFERGSTQPLHVDTFYMPPPPGGRLIVTSICLEDVHPSAGPVRYVPGSHRIPPWLNPEGTRHVRTPDEEREASAYMQAEADRRSLVTEAFAGRAGDVLIWHEQLFHGGSPIQDMTRTRRSLVTHYWRASEMEGADVRPSESAGYWIWRPHQQVARPDT